MKDTRHIYRDKRGYLIASIRVNGKQKSKVVKSEAQAKEWFLLMETQCTKASDLTFKQLNDAANALDLLKTSGVELSLYETVQKFLGDSRRLETKEIAFPEAIAQYLERSKVRVGERTLTEYRTLLAKFSETVSGDKESVGSFKKPDALKFLDRFLERPPTWLAYKRTLSRFFTEAVRMEWCQDNPFIGLDAPKCKPPERAFLSVEDTSKALDSVARRQPHLIHFLTLGLFGGIRPIESLRLTSNHINLSTGYIHMTGDIVKSHSFKERVVPINNTLRAWLEAYPFEDKPIPVSDVCNVAKALRKCAELDHWPRTPDCLRHSFATYQFALTNNSAETAAICGHSESIAMKHYRGRVTKEEAERFFSIVPTRARA